jgi:hypothetical protein
MSLYLTFSSYIVNLEGIMMSLQLKIWGYTLIVFKRSLTGQEVLLLLVDNFFRP